MDSRAGTLRIAVGPAPSHWGAGRVRSFYHELACSPVDYVYLGETACPSRSCLTPGFVDGIRDELRRAGKEVYASSLILSRDKSHHHAFADLARRVESIEINSPGFLPLARRYPAVAGMFLNVCNSTAARILAQLGVKRIALPCELDVDSIRSIANRSPVPVEVVVHGHVPVAMSGTCHTARCLGPVENGCEKLCRRLPEGMV